MPNENSRDAARLTRQFLFAARPGIALALLRGGLAPLGWAWGAALSARRTLYRRGVLHAARVAMPVVSIGNISVGGTGKTPLVEWVARRAMALGIRPGIVARGYGASAGSAPRRVSAESPAESDEARLLAARLPDAVVVAGRDRVLGARIAIDAGARAIILDDGFQHLRLARDLDIVLLDPRIPYGGGRVLPAGPLREPWSSMRDADLVLTVAEPAGVLGAPSGARTVRAARRGTGVRRAPDRRDLPESLRACRVFLLSGIGNPAGFRASAAETGALVVGEACFADHHRFTERDLAETLESSRRAGAETILTTEKDAARIPAAFLSRGDVAILEIALEIVENEAALTAAVDRVLRGERRERT